MAPILRSSTAVNIPEAQNNIQQQDAGYENSANSTAASTAAASQTSTTPGAIAAEPNPHLDKSDDQWYTLGFDAQLRAILTSISEKSVGTMCRRIHQQQDAAHDNLTISMAVAEAAASLKFTKTHAVAAAPTPTSHPSVNKQYTKWYTVGFTEEHYAAVTSFVQFEGDEIANFESSSLDFPERIFGINIYVSPEGAHVTWEPSQRFGYEVMKYTVYLGLKPGKTPDDIIFMPVYTGTANQVFLPHNTLSAACVYSSNKPAKLINITASNDERIGPSRLVKFMYLQKSASKPWLGPLALSILKRQRPELFVDEFEPTNKRCRPNPKPEDELPTTSKRCHPISKLQEELPTTSTRCQPNPKPEDEVPTTKY